MQRRPSYERAPGGPPRPTAARGDPQLADLALFLSQAYNLKAVADYELGPGASVPLDRASGAIDRAAQFIEQIAALLA